jgi:hypothetical protein
MAPMSQTFAVPQAPGRGPRKAVLRGVFLGAIVGVVATLLLVSMAWGANHVLSSDPRTFTKACGGASVTGTIWVDDPGVFTTVAVVDPKARSWEIAWGGHGEHIPSSTMIRNRQADYYTGSVLSATQLLGDTDGGTHRTAQVRPDGHQAWCDLDMYVTLAW